MNKFSIYQYLLILCVLVLGFTYALPNLYPTQPSIQVAYTDSGKSADQSKLGDKHVGDQKVHAKLEAPTTKVTPRNKEVKAG